MSLLGRMKLPASVVLANPFLLFFNLEAILKPRFLLVGKIEDMGLVPQIKGPAMLRALRMSEKRFIAAFSTCHLEDDKILPERGQRAFKDDNPRNKQTFHFIPTTCTQSVIPEVPTDDVNFDDVVDDLNDKGDAEAACSSASNPGKRLR
ncbi:unnamed protein product [Fraxinus pennsylvanica]|uniref:Uncharacterized protein n=1 Tax=Fraxinus pennsylvanica TaxID=56036 RepID=A0AAD2A3M8_9LAMI|nr:unnamed protein product [Fraxinus pennsylvanica]